MNANPEAKAAAMQEMSAVSHEMMAVLRTHRISYPKMIACIFGQAPVFISIFLATQQVTINSTLVNTCRTYSHIRLIDQIHHLNPNLPL